MDNVIDNRDNRQTVSQRSIRGYPDNTKTRDDRTRSDDRMRTDERSRVDNRMRGSDRTHVDDRLKVFDRTHSDNRSKPTLNDRGRVNPVHTSVSDRPHQSSSGKGSMGDVFRIGGAKPNIKLTVINKVGVMSISNCQ